MPFSASEGLDYKFPTSPIRFFFVMPLIIDDNINHGKSVKEEGDIIDMLLLLITIYEYCPKAQRGFTLMLYRYMCRCHYIYYKSTFMDVVFSKFCELIYGKQRKKLTSEEANEILNYGMQIAKKYLR